jgi:thiosulfate reductase cytochrome b subunit
MAIDVPTDTVDSLGHPRWVRLSHWIVASAVLTLAVSGFVILMAHPRLYWGVAGNDMTPALLDLPISRNHQHGGWAAPVPFYAGPGSPVSAARTYDIFNQNAWARSLHFLVAWFLVVPGLAYLLTAIFSGHLKRHLLPRVAEFSPRALGGDFVRHLRRPLPAARGGPPYGLLQKVAYSAVVVLLLPTMVLTGLTMSPAVANAYPFLLAMFGGVQSARTIHFFGFAMLVVFVLVHVAMVLLTGFGRQIRAMTVGR